MDSVLPVPRSPRWLALDIMKTVAIFIMILVHTIIMNGSKETIYSNFFYGLILVLEGIGAPAFVLAMGVSITLKNRSNRLKIFTRGLQLFVLGYLLNFFKFYPTIVLFKTFPNELFIETYRSNDYDGIVSFLLLGDILQFAAIAYIICANLYLWSFFKNHCFYIGNIVALLIFISSPMLYIYKPDSYLISFLYGDTFQVYFPLFPWIGFAFMGLSIGAYYKSNRPFNKNFLFTGILLTIVGIVGILYDKDTFGKDYYHRGMGGLIVYSGQLILFLFLYSYISTYFSKGLQNFIKFCSKNVTLIYIIQWILIYWNWYFIPYYSQNWTMICMFFILYLITTLLLTKFFNKIINYLKYA
ncbi:heparan-alpha-glucosaminide N-acetyltransferase domain-containing protein [Riemerella anatipestifer]|nr:heparan-alpha-glucosaminide N-acetyltransferase domain-containing protein [Riemerella anatipestifer]